MIAVRHSMVSWEIIPFYLSLALLGGLALAADALLNLTGNVWIGRYLGIPGVLLILASSGYSMRKRKLITSGKPVNLLRWHERLAWAGSLLVLVHAGIHFNAWLGWLAVWAMLINVASGLTGKFLIVRSRKRLEAIRAGLRAEGMSAEDIEEKTHWDSLTYNAVKQWRTIHVPITLAFTGLALAHIIAIFLFWGWK
ncbi:hypothetical protein [Novosphingobium sp.]|uniref:hypothetical protein n=1 Tax=Novosphingobium sp. TaxID=1874826 RepID=UPI0026218484|nr:hypothetical protein [Novosphingobium sp.]